MTRPGKIPPRGKAGMEPRTAAIEVDVLPLGQRSGTAPPVPGAHPAVCPRTKKIELISEPSRATMQEKLWDPRNKENSLISSSTPPSESEVCDDVMMSVRSSIDINLCQPTQNPSSHDDVFPRTNKYCNVTILIIILSHNCWNHRDLSFQNKTHTKTKQKETTKSAVVAVTPMFTFIWQQPSLQWKQSHQCLHLHGNNQVCSGNSHTSVYV